jgi:DnaK suppressor protein
MDLDKIRRSIESELEDVLSKSERLEGHLRNKDRTLPRDWSELAQFTENDEVLEALGARARARIEELQQALERIDAGTYAQCVSCGSEIGERRLDLLPTTTRCAACAA